MFSLINLRKIPYSKDVSWIPKNQRSHINYDGRHHIYIIIYGHLTKVSTESVDSGDQLINLLDSNLQIIKSSIELEYYLISNITVKR